MYPFRLTASRQATFPKGTALAVVGKFLVLQKSVPLGELAANAVSRLRGSSFYDPPVKMGFRNARRRF